jgi:hypothetical protein
LPAPQKRNGNTKRAKILHFVGGRTIRKTDSFTVRHISVNTCLQPADNHGGML